MIATSLTSHSLKNGTAHDHAIVIGGSVAGLTTARVLTDHFARVTIVERDHLPDTPEFRRGAPQALHAHLLLPQGQAILEQQFPGLIAELSAQGATLINNEQETQEADDGTWFNDILSLSCSRPLLEAALYRRLTINPQVHFVQEHEVAHLQIDRSGTRVTGVHVRSRHGSSTSGIELAADLVVDTTGRASRAPDWLAGLGYTPPAETTVNPFSGYTSRIYRRLPEFTESWKMMRIRRTPPDRIRGGMIVPLEGGRWHVTIVGMVHDYPPNDETGFLAFARSLPSRRLYETIIEAEPLTPTYSYRGTKNRLRHYEKLPRYLEGFLVSGDAVCALSPVHALGMTAAAIGSQTLAHCLAERPRHTDITGLARTFQRRLRRGIDAIWQKVTDSDRSWPGSETVEELIPPKFLRKSYREIRNGSYAYL